MRKPALVKIAHEHKLNNDNASEKSNEAIIKMNETAEDLRVEAIKKGYWKKEHIKNPDSEIHSNLRE